MFRQLLRKIVRRWPSSSTSSEEDDLQVYLQNGRRPWSRGYSVYKDRFIRATLADAVLMECFRNARPLPAKYGEFLDDRVVEYPWLFARLNALSGRILDAGSTLNFLHLLDQPVLANKNITIVTLAPECHCFWQKSISYVFADLRELPFRDSYFDEVVCISTLEHVGKDNSLVYAHQPPFKQSNVDDFRIAAKELKRVCKPGGKVYITVPFGRFTDFGWFQQFDGVMLDHLIAAFAPSKVEQTFFRYADGGWQCSTRESCAGCEGFNFYATCYADPNSTRDYDPDNAAASRGNAALEMWS
jgi:SAM-dependent methyltransferase